MINTNKLASHADRVEDDKERIAAPGDTVGHHVQNIHGVVDIANNLGDWPGYADHENTDAVARRSERIRHSPHDQQARQNLQEHEYWVGANQAYSGVEHLEQSGRLKHQQVGLDVSVQVTAHPNVGTCFPSKQGLVGNN